MGTFRTTEWINSEANRGTPLYNWFYSENFLAPGRTSAIPFQASEVSPGIGFTTFPMRFTGPMNEAINYANTASDPAHTSSIKKRKFSEEASDELAVKTAEHKQNKKDAKKSKKKATPQPAVNRERRNPNEVVYSSGIDLSGVPPPVCTCTGVPHQCYRWGAGRWQSSCCTTTISHYPLPMSSSRPGNRVSGRKMSRGAYEKLVQRLAAEGHDLSRPVDLKLHWARHGTNKFVTLR